MVVVGAGYIAVELSGIFNALGSKVSLLIRGETVSNPGCIKGMPYIRMFCRYSGDLTA